MRSYTYWLMALCLCVVVNIHAQTLKTYSGKFNGGYAVYTYKDNPEGGRIYEGKFVIRLETIKPPVTLRII